MSRQGDRNDDQGLDEEEDVSKAMPKLDEIM